MPNKLLNNEGMTLIEVMISLLLFLLVSLALLQTQLLTVDQNVRDALRDEAIGIAEMRMSQARGLCFTSTCDDLTAAKDSDGKNGATTLTGCPSGFPSKGVKVNRKIANANIGFCTNQDVKQPTTDVRQVVIEVGYMWRGIRYDHAISSLVRRS